MNRENGGEPYDWFDMHPEIHDEMESYREAARENNFARRAAENEEIDEILTNF